MSDPVTILRTDPDDDGDHAVLRTVSTDPQWETPAGAEPDVVAALRVGAVDGDIQECYLSYDAATRLAAALLDLTTNKGA